MEIIIETKTMPAFAEIEHKVKYVQDSVDAVVPDVNEDIGKIAAINHNVLLKRKDITNTGVIIGGEINITIACITEEEDFVEHIKLSKDFTVEFEIQDIDPMAKAQIALRLNNIESRIVNPRKVSASFEVEADLTVYTECRMDIDYDISSEYSSVIKTKEDSIEVLCPVNLCEKTFAINEQFSLPQKLNDSCRIISSNTKLHISDTQYVGTKLIVKGVAVHTINSMPKDMNYPLSNIFTSNFSQIIDTGIEALDNCIILPQMTSAYYDTGETISGECIINIEIHALLQVICRKSIRSTYLSDAYSNCMPCKNNLLTRQYFNSGAVVSQKINMEEKLTIADDCVDVLNVYSCVLQSGIKNGKFFAIVCFDIIYKNKTGNICSVRRPVEICSENVPDRSRLIDFCLCSTDIRPIETIIDIRINLEFSYYVCINMEYSKINTITLDEEKRYKIEDYPSVTLMKYENESLWEIAKQYRSSVEKIKSCNDIENLSDKFVIIPREC